MERARIDARAHLLTLVGRPITGFRGAEMTVLEVRDRTVLVRTPRATGGTEIRIAFVQRGIDLLLGEGQARPTTAALGPRSEFVSAVLLTLPGAARVSDPPRIALTTERPRLSSLGSVWPVALLVSSAAVALTTYGWTSSPARPVVTTWFLLACPGLALVGLLPKRGTLTLTVLAIATSLVLETLIAETMLESGLWSPRSTLVILLALTVGGSVVQLRATPAPPLDRGART